MFVKQKKGDFLPYALISPLILFVIFLALTPAAFTIVSAFFRVQLLNPPTTFSGLENFRDIIANREVMSSLANTFYYIVIGVTLSTFLGIFFATSLHHKFRGRSIVIAVLILPWALPNSSLRKVKDPGLVRLSTRSPGREGIPAKIPAV